MSKCKFKNRGGKMIASLAPVSHFEVAFKMSLSTNIWKPTMRPLITNILILSLPTLLPEM